MLLDTRGCLTEAGLRALAAAAPGAAPAELAGHVALCARCQDRVLAVAREPGPAAKRPSASRLWMGLLVAVAGLLLALTALFVARVLSTPPP
jgi:hypothetical protein